MARRRPKKKKLTRRCQSCEQSFIPEGPAKIRPRCPYCGKISTPRKKIGQLEKRVDTLFSRLARFTRADKLGYVTCCTCGVRKRWDEVDNGHFMSRTFRATRWDFDNCWPQCKPCNSGFGELKWKPNESVKQAYVKFIDQTLGEGEADRLWQKANDPNTKRPGKAELERMILHLECQCESLGIPTT